MKIPRPEEPGAPGPTVKAASQGKRKGLAGQTIVNIEAKKRYVQLKKHKKKL